MADERVQYVIELNDKLSPGLKRAAANAMGLDRSMHGVKRATRGASMAAKGLGASLAAALGPISLITAAIAALTAGFRYASDAISEARDWESDLNALKFASGDAQTFGENLAFVSETSDRLGLSIQTQVREFKDFAGAVRGTNLEGQATKDIFEGVAIASSVLGLKADESAGALRALQQMASKGKVSAEELRQQLGERLPGALKIAAKSMGVTQMELNKMMDRGELMSDVFLPRFAKALKEEFGEGVADAMKSSRAQLNRFNNALFEIKTSIGSALLPVVNSIMSAFMKFFNVIKENITPIKKYFELSIRMNYFLFEIIGKLFRNVWKLTGVSVSFRDVIKGVFVYLERVFDWLLPKFSAFTSFVADKLTPIFLKLWKIQLTPLDLLFRGIQGIYKSIKTISTAASSLYSSLSQLFADPFNMDNVQKSFSQLKSTLLNSGSEIADNFANSMGLSEIVKKGLQGLAKTGRESRKSKESEGVKIALSGGGSQSISGAISGDAGKSSEAVSKISSGRPTTVNIDVQKMVENLNITSANMEESYSKVKENLTKVLFDVLNQSNNYVLNNG